MAPQDRLREVPHDRAPAPSRARTDPRVGRRRLWRLSQRRHRTSARIVSPTARGRVSTRDARARVGPLHGPRHAAAQRRRQRVRMQPRHLRSTAAGAPHPVSAGPRDRRAVIGASRSWDRRLSDSGRARQARPDLPGQVGELCPPVARSGRPWGHAHRVVRHASGRVSASIDRSRVQGSGQSAPWAVRS